MLDLRKIRDAVRECERTGPTIMPYGATSNIATLVVILVTRSLKEVAGVLVVGPWLVPWLMGKEFEKRPNMLGRSLVRLWWWMYFAIKWNVVCSLCILHWS